MEFWKKNKWKIIAPVLIVLVLAVAFVFGDKNIPEQKDPTEQPGISAPAQPTQDDEMPEEPDDTATPEDTETATEDVPAPSNEQTADEAEKVDIDRSEFMTPEEMGAGATGEYEEVNGMMIDTGTGLDKYFTSPVPESLRRANRRTWSLAPKNGPARSPFPAPRFWIMKNYAPRKNGSWCRRTAGFWSR